MIRNPKISKTILNQLKKRISEIREEHRILVVFGSPTEGNWLGIANATKSLYPDNSIEIPQNYSNTLFSEKQTIDLCEYISQLNFNKIIISGFASYFYYWIDLLYPKNIIEIIFHGTFSEFHEKAKQIFIGKLISYGKAEKIKRFGFIKKGLNQTFSTLYNFKSYHQPLPIPTIPQGIALLKLDKSKIHIGVFGADTFNKNLHNQVIHALMIENTIVHVLDKSIFKYLELDERIVEHGKNLPRDEFLRILGSMDLNLYMSYSESWGLVAYESEAMGVPCLRVTDTNYLEEIISALASNKKF
jgi:glycosyltransferase involved in cell wall biosynthesis